MYIIELEIGGVYLDYRKYNNVVHTTIIPDNAQVFDSKETAQKYIEDHLLRKFSNARVVCLNDDGSVLDC